MRLNIYTNDSLTEIKRVAEADEVKIPYRVAMYVAQSLDTINLDSQDDLFKFVINSLPKIDKILKATFGLSETELECVNSAELVPVAMEIYKWATDKFNGLNGDSSKNV